MKHRCYIPCGTVAEITKQPQAESITKIRDELLDRLDRANARFKRAYKEYANTKSKKAWKALCEADDAFEAVTEEVAEFVQSVRYRRLH